MTDSVRFFCVDHAAGLLVEQLRGAPPERVLRDVVVVRDERDVVAVGALDDERAHALARLHAVGGLVLDLLEVRVDVAVAAVARGGVLARPSCRRGRCRRARPRPRAPAPPRREPRAVRPVLPPRRPGRRGSQHNQRSERRKLSRATSRAAPRRCSSPPAGPTGFRAASWGRSSPVRPGRRAARSRSPGRCTCRSKMPAVHGPSNVLRLGDHVVAVGGDHPAELDLLVGPVARPGPRIRRASGRAT